MEQEEQYIRMRLRKARWQSLPFYFARIHPIKKRKIVFTCIEGTTGYTCNPKYIAEELIRRNQGLQEKERYELVWLVNDVNKSFPKEIRLVKNTLFHRAYELTTARIWVDNSRKQLECRKRKGQTYIQTWHAKLGFKPTGLDRGDSFTKIAYLVSKHDSNLVDYWLSNSDWYDDTLLTGSLYEGKTFRAGSPRCDILIRATEDKAFKGALKEKMAKNFGIESDGEELHFLMYAPTFRSGSQSMNRSIEEGDFFPDYDRLKVSLERRFGGTWIILLRLHPQLVVRGICQEEQSGACVDVSQIDDMYELLAGCEGFLTDYSSAAFDAAVMKIPVFLYCEDYREYERERGKLLWDLKEKNFPFPLAEDDDELNDRIEDFDDRTYSDRLDELFTACGMEEDGRGAETVADLIEDLIEG